MKYSKRKINKRSTLVLLKKRNLVWLLSLLLLSVNVFFAVQTASSGARIALYEEEIEELERENEEISMNLVNLTSLTKLNHVSEEMGFKKMDNIVYLQEGESFAQAR